MIRNSYNFFTSVLRSRPQAVVFLRGSAEFPDISGIVRFYATEWGTLVAADVVGLPHKNGECEGRIFGFHIHAGESCTGNADDPFADALSHYDTNLCPHPYHAGDMPPLFGCRGRAFSVFLTDRVTVGELIGKTVIIHDSPDDFTTQPSGNAGTKIACGVISPTARHRW